jgi:3-oxoisoapionate kinase
MSKHPVTPADESDLRLHLGKQTSKQIGLMDILNVVLELEEARKVLKSVIDTGNEVVLFDAIYQEQMQTIGALVDNHANDKTLFSVGSSGIEMALGAHWESKGVLKERNIWNNAGNAGPILVASGSCSPVTSGQIAWAVAQGFVEVALDTEVIASTGDASSMTEENVATISKVLQDGKNVILHTSKGNDDPRVGRTNEIFTTKGWDESVVRTKTAELYGTALGAIVRRVAEQTSLKRIVIAGGDTSSYAARAMGIEAVEMIAPLSPGAPLCKAYAPGSAVDGLEVNFKGGQVGREDYFGMVAEGTSV